MTSDDDKSLQKTVTNLGIGNYERHVLLCTGPTCCTPEEGQQAWDTLKKEMKEHGLVNSPGGCYRTKVGCLRVCEHGPTMLVYPEGTWYRDISPERIPQFVQQHLIEGKPVEEWIFARNPLSEEESK